MAKQLTSKQTLLFSTGGSPADTDIVTTTEKVFTNPVPLTVENNEMGHGKGGSKTTITIADKTTVDFNVVTNVKSSGTAGTAPKIAELLKACGMKETIEAGVSVTYTPELQQTQGTAKNYIDGEVREITGIAGNFAVSLKVGELAKWNFSFKGFTDAEPTTEANPTVTLDTNDNLIVTSLAAITVGGGNINLTSVDFDSGNDIQETYALSMKEYYVENFKPTLKLSAVKTKGNADHWTDLKSNTIKEIVATLGSGAGGQMVLTAPYCNPSNVSESDDAGKVIYEKDHVCQSSVGGDNFSIVFK